MKDIDWQDEIRKMIIDRVRKELKMRILKEAKELRCKMKSSNISNMIREDRDARIGCDGATTSTLNLCCDIVRQ